MESSVKFGLTLGVIAGGMVILFPFRAWQTEWWIVAFAFFVGGDSVTTAVIQRYDDLTEAGWGTRWICGANPSAYCAIGTRFFYFAILFVFYLGLQFTPLMQIQRGELLITSIPIVIAAGGLTAIIWNLYHFYHLSQN